MNYLVIGDDEYLKQAETAKIRERFLAPDQIELNYSAHEYDDINGIMDSVATMPFLAERRVVLVKDAHRLSSDSLKTILSYLENPLKTSVLVLSSENSFRDLKEGPAFSKLTNIVDASKPDPLTIKKWARDFLKKENVEICPDALELLFELKGQDTGGIKMELEKIIAFSGGEKITSKHIEDLVDRSVRETIFKLVDALNGKDSLRVFRILEDLYEQKKEPHEIIGYLAWYVRLMQKIVLASAREMDIKTLSGQLGYSPGYTKVLIDQSRKYTAPKISKWLSFLFGADNELKTGKKEAHLAVEMLLASLCNK